jgi:hypothetical protein
MSSDISLMFNYHSGEHDRGLPHSEAVDENSQIGEESLFVMIFVPASGLIESGFLSTALTSRVSSSRFGGKVVVRITANGHQPW